MKIRPKTVRRLLILAAGAVVLTSVIGVAFTARRFSRESQISAARVAGLSAFESREYPKALDSLSKYILSRPNDVEALYALGCARMAMETPTRDSLFEARLRFQQLLVIDPNHLPASLKLLEVYEQTHQFPELLELSNRVLARNPQHPTAMRSAAVALTRLKKTPEARQAWEALVKLRPDDVHAQSQYLSAMRADGASADAVVEYAQKLADENGGDSRFAIPLATALREAGREADSLAVLKKLTAQPPADQDAVIELVTMLDRAGAFDDAQRVLQRAADSLNSSVLNVALVQRVWQGGRAQDVITLTDKLLKDGRSQPTVLALRALSLVALNRKADADPLLAQLSADGSPTARAWEEALRVEFSATPLNPPQRVEALSKALSRDPNNGILYTWLARALMQVGEVDQAARCYRESAQRLPSWPTPCLELAQVMLGVGRPDDAIPAAKAAYLRSPSSLATQIQLARVRYAALSQRFDEQEQSLLLQFVTKLREQVQDEPSLLPIHVALLARTGDSASAQALITSALAAQPSAATLLSLYQVNGQYSLGRADAILQAAQQHNAVTVDLVTSHARDLVLRGDVMRARELAKSLQQPALTSADAALAEARLHTLLGDASAASTWRLAATRFPDHLSVQVAAIEEGSGLIKDRAFQQQLIERIRALTGENALYWRIEQAKFLAASDNIDDSRQALTLASELLRQHPTRVDLRVLLGRVLTRLDSRPTALEHLRTAFEQAPSNPSIGLELVEAFIQLGRLGDAQDALRRISSFDIEDATTRNRVVRVLLDNGMTRELIAMLERARQRRFIDQAGLLLLAETLATNDQPTEAAQLYEELLAREPSPAVLAAVAAFRRDAGDVAAATELISRIATAPGTAAARHDAVARFHARFGEVDQARESFNLAVVDPSSDVFMLRDAIAMECTARNFVHARKLLELGRRRFGSQPLLDRVEIELAAMQAGNSDAAVEKLVEVLASNPSSKTEAEALRASISARKNGSITPELAATLVQLANRYPAAFDLQREAITACIVVGQSGPAIAIAHRLSGLSQSRADLQELAARTLAQFGQWNSARKVAERWRSLVGESTREPDLLLAMIAQASGKSEQSLALSDRYAATFDPQQDAHSIATRAAALIAMGRSDACFDMLSPWIEQNVEVRSVWLTSILSAPLESVEARIDQLARATPAESTQERVRLAAACLQLSQRLEGDRIANLGLELIRSVASASDAADSTRILQAELLRACGQPDAAEVELRAVLSRTPENVRAKNSLAYLLLSQSKEPQEALQLATAAAAAMPSDPNILDTLARALLAQGDLAGAQERFREALRLAPDSFDALVGMALVRHRQGSFVDAQAMVSRIDELAKSQKTMIPAHLRKELLVLRQSLSGSQE